MKFAESLQDLEENPTAYGMPTFEEFRKNKEKYMGRFDDEVSAIDRGDPNLGCLQKYYITDLDGLYRCESLEHAEKIALDMGLSLHHDFKVDPQLRKDHSGGFYNQVTFRSKRSLAKRANW